MQYLQPLPFYASRAASKSARMGVKDFHDQLGHIVCHLDQLNRLVGHLDQLQKYLDQLHKYKKIQRISQKDKEL